MISAHVSLSAAPDGAVRIGLATAHFAGYIGLALFVGGLAFLALLYPPAAMERHARAVLASGWAIGAAAAVAAMGLHAAYSQLRSLSWAINPHTMAEFLATQPGQVRAATALLWLLAAPILAATLQAGEKAVRSPGWRIAALAVGFGLLRTTGMAGHSGESGGFTAVAGLLHLAGAVVWLGGLVFLLGLAAQRRPDVLEVVVPRFSKLAMVSVGALVLAGGFLAMGLVGSVDALRATDYGRLLLLKVALVALVLAVAQGSRTWVAHRLDVAVVLRGDRATVRPFIYSVAAETGLGLAVVSAASALATANPG